MTAIATPDPAIDRDRWGRPYIRVGSKRVAYTRATTVADTLDDRYNLELWKQRQVALGLARRPDLLALASSLVASADSDEGKKKLNRVCEDAHAAAASGAAANLGTALHSLTEQVDRGNTPTNVPAELVADIAAYTQLVRQFEWVAIEKMMVLDTWKVAGTPDRLGACSDGRIRVVDLKTGSGATTYGQRSIAVQLALYARSQLYDPVTFKRTDVDVDLNVAYVIHAPAGTGTATLHSVDINAGWEAALKSLWTREWRNRKDLIVPVDVVTADPITQAIATAATEAELTAAWSTHRSDWTPAHTSAAAARKQALAATA